jgi:hypothetical protein
MIPTDGGSLQRTVVRLVDVLPVLVEAVVVAEVVLEPSPPTVPPGSERTALAVEVLKPDKDPLF